MYKGLSQGVKISITRSISTAFEQYMARIQWEEDKFNLHNFIQDWKNYITTSAAWYSSIDESIKNDPVFHEALASKINETIEKILNEPPTDEQIEEIEKLQEEAGTDYAYSCKAEAKYVLEQIQNELKKKKNN
ncbi:hypothetical protein [Falsibacillus pallidus]|uniref:Group-specific protein n=1 Tax=Falsibacillus pallidus TaxID=493781 RepID=A0A370GD34_9BACI|nr:hypothetical protein [Falsibacillus pallidus]RDI41621.1 hypothetical protein DFR59_10774 [Falsibacillus pallidus]